MTCGKRRINHAVLTAAWICLCQITLSGDEQPTAAIVARDCFLRVKDQAAVPALERGQLQRIDVEPGDRVTASQILAVLDDVEASLNLELAELDLQVAEKQTAESSAVPIAAAAHEEARKLLGQVTVESHIARRTAEADISIRQAEKDRQVSQDELDRALAARAEFRSSVSDQQLAKLTLVRDQDILKLEKAQHDREIELLRSQSREMHVEQQQLAVLRLEHEVSEARTKQSVQELNLQSLRKAVDIARERLERRKLRAPLDGMVVEKLCHAGEWVEPGEPILRVIRLDQLHVEGYVDAQLVDQSCRGRKVRVTCDTRSGSVEVDGVLTFVSPEIDAVNQQVQVRAEIRNPGGSLRPGQAANMQILREFTQEREHAGS